MASEPQSIPQTDDASPGSARADARVIIRIDAAVRRFGSWAGMTRMTALPPGGVAGTIYLLIGINELLSLPNMAKVIFGLGKDV